MIKIAIVGGGFGGVYTLLNLIKTLPSDKNIKITLFNKNNYFLFTPLLHEVATGGLNADLIAEGLRELINDKNVEVIEGNVSSIDLNAKSLNVNNTNYEFDYIVIATGATTNFRGVLGQENAYTLKNLHDANEIKRKIISGVEKLHIYKETSKFVINIVGAGHTGIELVCEIQELISNELTAYYKEEFISKIKINLISATEDVLPIESKKIREIAKKIITKKNINLIANKTVKLINKDSLILDDETVIDSDLTIWVAGVKPNIPYIKQEEVIDKTSGRIKVNEFLQNKSYNFAYAVGDCALFIQDEKPLPMLAQVAVSQAEIAAKNIKLNLENKPTQEYKYKTKGSLISLGQWQAVGNIGGHIVTGRTMWWIWRTIYLFKFLSWRKRIKIAVNWTINLFSPRDIVTY